MSLLKLLKGRRRWVLGTILLAPPILWLTLILITPTDWARRRLVDRLERATGQKVAFGKVSLGLLGRFQVRDVRLATEQTPNDPWLEAGSASLDLNLIQVLIGRCRPADIEVLGVRARVLRRKDGSLEISDLLGAHDDADAEPSSPSQGTDFTPTVNLVIRDASVEIVDDTASTRLEVTDVHARATWSAKTATIDELNGRIGGGTFEFAAKVDRVNPRLLFEVETRLRSVPLSDGTQGLNYLVPVVAGSTDSVDGKLSLKLALHGEGASRDSLRKTLNGHGTVVIDPINLDGSHLLRDVEIFGRLPRSERMGSVSSNFEIAHERVATEDLTIKVAGLPIVLAGWTDFEGHLDYRAKSELTEKKLPKVAKSLLADLDLNVRELSAVHIEGTVDQVKVTLDHGSVANTADRLLKDKKKMKDVQDRLLDKILR